jgi:hypothetical protein
LPFSHLGSRLMMSHFSQTFFLCQQEFWVVWMHTKQHQHVIVTVGSLVAVSSISRAWFVLGSLKQ